MESEPDDVSRTLNLRDLDPNVKSLFKSWCARQGVSMKDAIEEFMRQASKGKPELDGNTIVRFVQRRRSRKAS